jgi:hypothetical protein
MLYWLHGENEIGVQEEMGIRMRGEESNPPFSMKSGLIVQFPVKNKSESVEVPLQPFQAEILVKLILKPL